MFEVIVQAIKDSVKTEVVDVDGRKFSTRPITAVPEIPDIQAIQVISLQAIVDYIQNKIDARDQAKMFVHVRSPHAVTLEEHLRDNNDRYGLVTAVYNPEASFVFGRQYDQIEFLTKLQANFEDTDNRRNLQRFVGSLAAESSLHLQDDGVSQSTTVKAGVRNLQESPVPNPLVLVPYRTFPEVQQPASPFILRLQRRDDEPPTISLWEADNGKWKVEAIANIKAFFEGKIGDVPVLA